MEENHRKMEPAQADGHKRIGGRIIRGMALLALSLIISSSVVVALHFNEEIRTQYSAFAHDYAWSVADYIDGDRIPGYLESGIQDDYYDQVEAFIDALLKQSNLRYLYVFVPREKDFVYIWDGDVGDGIREDLGVVGQYVEGDRELIARTFRTDPVEKLMLYPADGIATAFVPLFDSAGNPVALVGADFSIQGLIDALKRFQFGVSLSILLVSSLFMVLYYLLVDRGILRPIGILNRATTEMVSHLDQESERFHADIHTGDEIEELAANFEKMDEELRDYIVKVSNAKAEQERIGAELDLARAIQAGMLPRVFPPFPDRGEFDIYATMTPAKEVGGDFYDFFLIDDDHLGLVMADVSGKGVGAALFMAVSKVRIKDQTMQGGSPCEVLSRVNSQLCEDEATNMFVTVWLGILTISTGDIVCANAGHEYPAICRNDGGFHLEKAKHGHPVGIYDGAAYHNEQLHLDPGELLFLYTDGVPEATTADLEMFGEERMLAALNENRGETPQELLARVKETVDRFVGDREPFDDLTMLAVRRL